MFYYILEGEIMRIFEDEKNDEVIIDDIRIKGFILDDRCSKCNNLLIINEDYDAYFCAYCNEWVEDTCGDPNCMFCKDRPKKPL